MAAAVIAGIAVYFFRESDTRAVVKITEKLAEYGTKSAGEGNVSLAVKSQGIGKLFADDATISLNKAPVFESFGPAELVGNMMRYFGCFQSVRLGAEDVHVSFPAGNEALAVFEGTLEGTIINKEKVEAEETVVCRLKKVKGDWKIVSLKLEEKIKQ